MVRYISSVMPDLIRHPVRGAAAQETPTPTGRSATGPRIKSGVTGGETSYQWIVLDGLSGAGFSSGGASLVGPAWWWVRRQAPSSRVKMLVAIR